MWWESVLPLISSVCRLIVYLIYCTCNVCVELKDDLYIIVKAYKQMYHDHIVIKYVLIKPHT